MSEAVIQNGSGNAKQQTPSSENEVKPLSFTAKFDKLGPIIVNSNGTLSRIPNWENLTENEQLNTLRLIAKRNKKRMDPLKEAELDNTDQNNGEMKKAGTEEVEDKISDQNNGEILLLEGCK